MKTVEFSDLILTYCLYNAFHFVEDNGREIGEKANLADYQRVNDEG